MSHAEPIFDPSRPALLITYGSSTNCHRPLDRDLLLVGRGRACDIGLASPEVAEVHCILNRNGNTWSVRDCGSRNGTRLNGQPVHEAPLRDGDSLRVGNFVLHLQLPPSPAEFPTAGARRGQGVSDGTGPEWVAVLRENEQLRGELAAKTREIQTKETQMLSLLSQVRPSAPSTPGRAKDSADAPASSGLHAGLNDLLNTIQIKKNKG
jgi:pSer/pThr/pTyr-binding forkhead associated (FHA) protein